MPAHLHKPTLASRDQVRKLRMAGYSVKQMSRIMGMNSRTLQRHYGREVNLAIIHANAEIADALYKQAKKGNVKAAIYWLEHFAPAWKPEQGEVDGPIPVTIHLPESQWEHTADGGPLSREIATTSD